MTWSKFALGLTLALVAVAAAFNSGPALGMAGGSWLMFMYWGEQEERDKREKQLAAENQRLRKLLELRGPPR